MHILCKVMEFQRSIAGFIRIVRLSAYTSAGIYRLEIAFANHGHAGVPVIRRPCLAVFAGASSAKLLVINRMIPFPTIQRPIYILRSLDILNRCKAQVLINQ